VVGIGVERFLDTPKARSAARRRILSVCQRFRADERRIARMTRRSQCRSWNQPFRPKNEPKTNQSGATKFFRLWIPNPKRTQTKPIGLFRFWVPFENEPNSAVVIEGGGKGTSRTAALPLAPNRLLKKRHLKK